MSVASIAEHHCVYGTRRQRAYAHRTHIIVFQTTTTATAIANAATLTELILPGASSQIGDVRVVAVDVDVDEINAATTVHLLAR
jgi:hypothetical protein